MHFKLCILPFYLYNTFRMNIKISCMNKIDKHNLYMNYNLGKLSEQSFFTINTFSCHFLNIRQY